MTAQEEGRDLKTDEEAGDKKDYRQMTIRQLLNDATMISDLGRAMPKHCKPDRMARIALTAITRTPDLARCTQASFFKCLLDLSQWGLEPDGRRAHLIPFKKFKGTDREILECTLIIDYKGYVELAYRSGVVRNVHADVVREGDIFTYSAGRVIDHIPWFLRRDSHKPPHQGEIYAVYCIVELVGETTKAEVLSVDEVQLIKSRSAGWKAYEYAKKKGWSANSPWESNWEEMAKKTAFRRVSKWIPLSAEIRDAFDVDDDKVIEGESRHISSTPIAGLLGSMMTDDSDAAQSQEGPEDDGNQDPEHKPANGGGKTLGDIGAKAKAAATQTQTKTETKKEEPKTEVKGTDNGGTSTVVAGEVLPKPVTNGGPPPVPEDLVELANEMGLAQTIERLDELWTAKFVLTDNPPAQEVVDRAQPLWDFHEKRILTKVVNAAAATAVPVSAEAEQYLARFRNSKTKAGVEKIMADGKTKFTSSADLAAIAAAGTARLAEVVAKS